MANTSISEQSQQCLQRFKALAELQNDRLLEGDINGIDHDSIQCEVDDCMARFRAWGKNIAAFHVPTSRTSLDARLKDAPQIFDSAVSILATIEEYQEELLQILSGKVPNRYWIVGEDSDSSDDDDDDELHYVSYDDTTASKTSTCEVVLKGLKASISNLMSLSVLVRRSANRDDYAKAATRYTSWFSVPDISHVREKHGKAKYREPWLLDRLAAAITLRRKFLKYRNDHHERLTEERLDQAVDTRTIIASTKATTFVGDSNRVQGKHDANVRLEGSIGTATSYEKTVLEAEGAPKRLTVPPVPSEAFPGVVFEFGEPFQCPCCFTEQVVENRSDWKKHVYRDLRPYVCTFPECDLLMFKSRREWFQHELDLHRREWFCQFCDSSSFATKEVFVKHTKTGHPSIVTNSSIDALLLQSQVQVDKINNKACHLCDEWEKKVPQGRSNEPPLRIDSGQGDCFSSIIEFRRHLGRHMEQLALFALPRSDGEGAENEDSDSDTDIEALMPDVFLGPPDAAKGTDHVDSSREGVEEVDRLLEKYKTSIEANIGDDIGIIEDEAMEDDVWEPIEAARADIRKKGKTSEDAAEESARAAATETKASAKPKPIRFKDAVGRKFSFPFELCKTWAGMDELIQQAFLHVDVVGEHVRAGRFDLVDPNGELILKSVWEAIVQPDWSITMHMWPMPENSPIPSSRKGYPPPPPPPPPGGFRHSPRSAAQDDGGDDDKSSASNFRRVVGQGPKKRMVRRAPPPVPAVNEESSKQSPRTGPATDERDV